MDHLLIADHDSAIMHLSLSWVINHHDESSWYGIYQTYDIQWLIMENDQRPYWSSLIDR